MTVRLGNAVMRVHPVLPLLWGAMILMKKDRILLSGLCALLLHEAGHLCMIRLTRKTLTEMEWTPFGARMTVADLAETEALPAFLIALGGPLFSLMGCMLSPLLLRLEAFSFFFVQDFARFSLAMLALNLLPVLPLDGGRMLAAALSKFFPPQTVRRALLISGMAAGGALTAVSFFAAWRGRLDLLPCFAGLYLVYAASRERGETGAKYLSALIARRQRIEKNEPLPVQLLAAGEKTPLFRLLPRMKNQCYHSVLVLSPDGMTVLGRISEGKLCEALLKDPSESLGACLKNELSASKDPGTRSSASRG